MFCRADATVDRGDKTDFIHFSNPTAMAAVALRVICVLELDNRPLLNSFLQAGGVAAVVRLLHTTPCPITFNDTAMLIHSMLAWLLEQPETPGGFLGLANRFLEAGEKSRGATWTSLTRCRGRQLLENSEMSH